MIRAALNITTEEERVILRRVLPVLGWRPAGKTRTYTRGPPVPLTVRDGRLTTALKHPKTIAAVLAAAFADISGTVTNNDAWKAVASREPYTAVAARQVASAMRSLGFEHIRLRVDGKVSIVYVRGDRSVDRRRAIYVFRDPATNAIHVTNDPDPVWELPVVPLRRSVRPSRLYEDLRE